MYEVIRHQEFVLLHLRYEAFHKIFVTLTREPVFPDAPPQNKDEVKEMEEGIAEDNVVAKVKNDKNGESNDWKPVKD